MRALNLGILAHVDAGKTSLTERLLYAAGVIDRIGSVDAGSTRTDTLLLERQRGITIKSAVVSFVVNDVTVNLIDTPGHPDFIAEVERVLGVLDGVVLVISAVEGVQAQTRVLMRTLQRLRLPTLIFVNKIDRANADDRRVLQAITEKLSPAIIPMTLAHGLGARAASVTPCGAANRDHVASLAELLAEHDDALLAAYVDATSPLPYARLRQALALQTQQALVYPVFCGSAITGAGVDALLAGITELLPAAAGDAGGPAAGAVFKIDRGAGGEKVAYVRMYSGTLRTRERLFLRDATEQRITAITVFDRGSDIQRPALPAGRIGKVWGLAAVQIGDVIGAPRPGSARHHFAPPTLESVIVPRRPSDRGALRVALDQLAEQDPLINLRQDELRQELYVSLYGEVQKEVIGATLANDFHIEVDFRETTTICMERPVGTGRAVEFLRVEPNPFLATVGLRIAPGPLNSGVTFQRAIEVHGTMPPAFFKAVEDTVFQTLQQGIHGWQVTDCIVTMTHSGYAPRQSHAHQGFSKSMSSTGSDFRGLTPLVVMDALRQAGTMVYEPILRFQLEVPADTLGAVVAALGKRDAVPETSVLRGASCLLEGEAPAANIHVFQGQLPALSRGEGVLEYAFDSYQPVRGLIPTRARTDHNPLDRKEYLLHVLRRV